MQAGWHGHIQQGLALHQHGLMHIAWTADGVSTRHFTSKSEAQSYTRAGDFVAYWKITHMAYVSKKFGSTAYITQHTTDRVDTPWNNIDTNAYSSFVIIRM